MKLGSTANLKSCKQNVESSVKYKDEKLGEYTIPLVYKNTTYSLSKNIQCEKTEENITNILEEGYLNPTHRYSLWHFLA